MFVRLCHALMGNLLIVTTTTMTTAATLLLVLDGDLAGHCARWCLALVAATNANLATHRCAHALGITRDVDITIDRTDALRITMHRDSARFDTQGLDVSFNRDCSGLVAGLVFLLGTLVVHVDVTIFSHLDLAAHVATPIDARGRGPAVRHGE